jgi:ribonuclease HII
MSIADIKNKLDNLTINELRQTIGDYKNDDRIGVKKLVQKYSKKIESYDNELKRLYNMRSYERKYNDCNFICGIDEAGRGPLSGPVVSAAVILPKDIDILYVNDSKKLSEAKREELYEEIYNKAISIGVGISNVDDIDNINILNATYQSMRDAINNLNIKPDIILVDAVTIPNINIKQEGIIKGDAKSVSIAAASIIAKVTRDNMMKEYNELYPEYEFAKNKGYGTKDHINAIKKYGACPIHRKTFIKSIV